LSTDDPILGHWQIRDMVMMQRYTWQHVNLVIPNSHAYNFYLQKSVCVSNSILQLLSYTCTWLSFKTYKEGKPIKSM